MDLSYLALAAAEAEKFVGATAPNPPVGACIVRAGRVLGVGGHARAGTDHAEVVAIKQALADHGAAALKGATIYVTLEPCNHQGKTPPCTEAVLASGITRIVFGARDPNRTVEGGGAARLKEAGLDVTSYPGSTLCRDLISGFAKRFGYNRPWVVHKLAYRLTQDGALTMIPERGKKTFTSHESVRLAHLERRKCDAILTGMGTVLADNPLFNVRHVPDHPGKKRLLAVLSQTGRTAPSAWIERQQDELGFEVLHYDSIAGALGELGERGVLRILVEAGPGLSQALVTEELWDERLVFISRDGSDAISREHACSPVL